MRLVLMLLLGAAGAAWFLSIGHRRDAGHISTKRETAELAVLVLAAFVLYALAQS